MPKRTSRSAKALQRCLRRSGVEISLRQIENWTEEGLLNSGAQRGLGPGKGSASRLPDDSAWRARIARLLLKRHRRFDRAVLAMFARGRHKVHADKLARAFQRGIDNARVELASIGSTDDADLFTRQVGAVFASRAAKKPGIDLINERLSRLANARSLCVSRQLEDLFADLARVLLGLPLEKESVIRVATAFGIRDAVNEKSRHGIGLNAPLPLTALESVLAQCSLDRQAQRIKRTGNGEFAEAREDAKRVIRFAQAFAPIAAEQGLTLGAGFAVLADFDDLGTAWLAHTLIVVKNVMPDKLDSHLHLIKSSLPYFAAMSHISRHIEPRFHRALSEGPDYVRKLPATDRAELQEELISYKRDWPGKLTLAKSFSQQSR